jgi:hypothetical protein
MPYEDWRAKYQSEAGPEKLAKFDEAIKQHER